MATTMKGKPTGKGGAMHLSPARKALIERLSLTARPIKVNPTKAI